MHFLVSDGLWETQPDSVCVVGQRTRPVQVQSEPYLPSDVVLGQLVTERNGLENGIVLSFSSQPFWGSGTVCSRLVLGANTFSPTEVGALSVVAHPDIGQCLFFLIFRLALLLGSQPAAVYHLTHSIISAVGSLLPEVSYLIPCFHSGRTEWRSPRMGRLALSPEGPEPVLSAQRR